MEVKNLEQKIDNLLKLFSSLETKINQNRSDIQALNGEKNSVQPIKNSTDEATRSLSLKSVHDVENEINRSSSSTPNQLDGMYCEVEKPYPMEGNTNISFDSPGSSKAFDIIDVEKEQPKRQRKVTEKRVKNLPSFLADAEEMENRIAIEKQSYAAGLTIHGANRIATGGPLSQVIWSILVIGSFLTALFISKEHLEAFLMDHSSIKTQLISMKEMEFPAITICNWKGIVRERQHFGGRSPIYTRPELVNISSLRECGRNLTKCGYQETTFLQVKNISSDFQHNHLQNNLVDFDDTTNCFTVRGFSQKSPSDILSIESVAKRVGDHMWSEIFINPSIETFFEANPNLY